MHKFVSCMCCCSGPSRICPLPFWPLPDTELLPDVLSSLFLCLCPFFSQERRLCCSIVGCNTQRQGRWHNTSTRNQPHHMTAMFTPRVKAGMPSVLSWGEYLHRVTEEMSTAGDVWMAAICHHACTYPSRSA